MERPSILVVDDDQLTLKLLDRVLTLTGYEVVTAGDGREALQRLAAGRFDAAVVDIRMPEMTGLEVLDEIKRADPSIEVIMTTAHPELATALEALKAGAYDYLQKPLNQDELRHRLHRALERRFLNAELRTFASTVAHELRGPLRAIRGFVQIVLQDHGDVLPLDGRDLLGKVIAAADRMNALVADLLAYCRLNSADLKLESVDLDVVLARVEEQLAAEIRARHAEFLGDLPLGRVTAHPSTLTQVLVNLVANALKFVPLGVVPQVRIWGERREGWVRLWVEDKGIGIAPRYHRRIFGVFQRLHTLEDYPGTGIGLALVRNGILRMGGRAGVESEVGRGSRFWIELRPPEEGS